MGPIEHLETVLSGTVSLPRAREAVRDLEHRRRHAGFDYARALAGLEVPTGAPVPDEIAQAIRLAFEQDRACRDLRLRERTVAWLLVLDPRAEGGSIFEIPGARVVLHDPDSDSHPGEVALTLRLLSQLRVADIVQRVLGVAAVLAESLGMVCLDLKYGATGHGRYLIRSTEGALTIIDSWGPVEIEEILQHCGATTVVTTD